jgi:aspartyl protease family protein
MRVVLAFVVFATVVAVGLGRDVGKFFSRPADATAMVAAAPARPAPQPTEISSYRTVKLVSDSRGHFNVEARIDGRRIDAVVDTGASMVVLNESSAARAGIFVRPSDFTGRANTANGVGKFAPVRINRIELNGIVVRDVQAAVMTDDSLKTNLLGMSFLSKVRFTHDRGRLILEQ